MGAGGIGEQEQRKPLGSAACAPTHPNPCSHPLCRLHAPLTLHAPHAPPLLRREAQSDVVIRVLRLFNLCEIGPTVSKIESDTDSGAPGGLTAGGRPGSGGAAAPQRSDGSAPGSAGLRQNGSASDLRALRPLSRNESGSSLHQQGQAAAAAAQQQGREEGEVSPQHSQGELRQQHLHLQPPQVPQAHGSPSKDRRVGWRLQGAGRRVAGCWTWLLRRLESRPVCSRLPRPFCAAGRLGLSVCRPSAGLQHAFKPNQPCLPARLTPAAADVRKFRRASALPGMRRSAAASCRRGSRLVLLTCRSCWMLC